MQLKGLYSLHQHSHGGRLVEKGKVCLYLQEIMEVLIMASCSGVSE